MAGAIASIGMLALAPAAHADDKSVTTHVYKFYHAGGFSTTRTGEIDFTVTETRDGSGLVDVKGTLSGHNNVQGSALGIKMDFTQPYVVSGDKGRYELKGSATLQSCIVKQLPVCGPSVEVTFNAVVNFAGPQSPATARSSNDSVFSIYDTP